MLKSIFKGMLIGIANIIPGVSGSMMLLLLGYYNPIIKTIKEFFLAVLRVDFPVLLRTILILVPFGIGVLIGMVAIAKMIEIVFERFPDYAYWSIIGLLLASPIAILIVGALGEITVVSVFTGTAAFICGWYVSNKLGEK